MRIAVIGCSHGTLDDIYASAAECDAEAKARGEPPIELILCCGDFQVRTTRKHLHTRLNKNT
jgi:lariat debranching enzyme